MTSLNVTWRPDLIWPGAKIFTKDAQRLNEQLCQIWRRCAPPFFCYLRKTDGGGAHMCPPGRARVRNIFMAVSCQLWCCLISAYEQVLLIDFSWRFCHGVLWCFGGQPRLTRAWLVLGADRVGGGGGRWTLLIKPFLMNAEKEKRGKCVIREFLENHFELFNYFGFFCRGQYINPRRHPCTVGTWGEGTTPVPIRPWLS